MADTAAVENVNRLMLGDVQQLADKLVGLKFDLEHAVDSSMRHVAAEWMSGLDVRLATA